MFSWLPWRREPPAIPDGLWRRVLSDYPFIERRPTAELERLRRLASRFLRDKEFTGAGGLVITDRIALSIAVQAVLPVLHLGLAWYDDFVGIVVHPGEVLARRSSTDDAGVFHQWEEVLAGEAMERGPVMLSWHDVQAAGHAGESAYNVVIHEFAHKIDMRDGEADGCPPLASTAAREAWREAMEAEYEAFREKVIIAERFGGARPWLDPYGAQEVSEFFAVACEGYFVDRARFAQEHVRLVGMFDTFFGPPSRSPSQP